MEQAQTTKRHHNSRFITGINDLLVADRAAGFYNGTHAATAGTLNVVAKREEGVAAQANTSDFA